MQTKEAKEEVIEETEEPTLETELKRLKINWADAVRQGMTAQNQANQLNELANQINLDIIEIEKQLGE